MPPKETAPQEQVDARSPRENKTGHDKTPGPHRKWRKDARAAPTPFSIHEREMCSSKVKLTCWLAARRIEEKKRCPGSEPAPPCPCRNAQTETQTDRSSPVYMDMPRSRRLGRSIHTLRSPTIPVLVYDVLSVPILFHAMQEPRRKGRRHDPSSAAEPDDHHPSSF